MTSSDPVNDLNRKIQRAVGEYLSLPPRSATEIKSWECHIGRIADRLEYNTLVVSDLSANYGALLGALLLRGLVELSPDGIVPTKEGLATHIVINGDLNDRGSELVICLWLISHLRGSGMRVSTVIGNHEGYLLSFLVHRPIQEILIDDLELRRYDDSKKIEKVPITPGDWAEGLAFWYLLNKGSATVHALAQFDDYLVKKNKPNLLPQEYREALRDVGLEWEVIEGARSAIVHSPVCRRFIRGLVGCVIDQGVCFAHAALPEVQFSPGKLLRELPSFLTQQLRDPKLCWRSAVGHHYSGKVFHSPKYPHAHLNREDKLQGDYGPLGSLIWARLPKGIGEAFSSVKDTELSSAFSTEWLSQLRGEGLQAIVRGHDGVHRIGFEQQTILRREGVSVLNVDVGLSTSGALGYCYITQSGEVYAFRSKENDSI